MIVCGASPLQNGKCNNSRAFYRAEFLAPTPGTTPQGHLLCLSGIQATCSGQFLSSRRGCRIGASQRTKVEAHTNMHFFVRSLEVREVMCPCPPGLTGSGAARRSLAVSGEQEVNSALPHADHANTVSEVGFRTHGLHRDAVGQAVFLVRAGLVESKAVKERLMGLQILTITSGFAMAFSTVAARGSAGQARGRCNGPGTRLALPPW